MILSFRITVSVRLFVFADAPSIYDRRHGGAARSYPRGLDTRVRDWPHSSLHRAVRAELFSRATSPQRAASASVLGWSGTMGYAYCSLQHIRSGAPKLTLPLRLMFRIFHADIMQNILA